MPSSISNSWEPLDTGAGGWLNGIDIAPDDTMVVRTDTYGAYIWNGTEWQQLVTSTSMPAATVAAGTPQGVYEIEIAPSDTNVLYMEYSGDVYRSDNKGETWTQTTFATVTENPNDPYRMNGQKMAVDPNNADIVYVGTPQDGLFVTKDGGATWQKVGAIPVSAKDSNGVFPGITGIAFDPAASTIGGNSSTIYASSAGHGVFESTDGGVSWVSLSGGPTDVEYAAISKTGVYYAIGDNNTSLWSYANGIWTELLSNNTDGYHTVTIDPFNPDRILVSSMGGSLNESLDGGATWSGQNWNPTLSATDIPWLATTNATYLSIGGIVFDQLVPNKVWASDGVGVWNTSVPTKLLGSTPIVWNSQSAGIEQLVANEILVAPGGNPILASWDRAFIDVTDPNTFPSSYGPVSGKFAAGWSLDYASSNPKFIVGIADWWGVEESGYSTDGGQTWNLFPTMPSFAGKTIGGTIAASSPTDIVWAPANGYAPVYTLDGGETWHDVVLPGVTDWSGFDFAYYLDTQTVTADRVLQNTFYLYYNGVYKSTDGGATWTEVYNQQISAASNFNSKIEAVPGEAGNLFFTGGPQGVATHPAGEHFYQSTDGGASWTAVPNVLEVKTFGFGAPATPGGYPSIYIVGWVNQVYGIWQSNDDAKSWTQIGDYPDGSLDNIKTISGDPNTYGQVYVGFAGSGYAYLPAAPGANNASAATISYMENPTDTALLTLNGVAEASSTVKIYDGSTLLGTATADSTGVWTFATAKLADGLHSFTTTSVDPTSLATTVSAALTVTVDTVAPLAPTVKSFSPDSGTVGDGVTSTKVLTLSGTAEANSTVKVYDGSTFLGTAAADSTGAWSFTTTSLATGAHAFVASATDLAGNTSTASSALTVTVTAAPVVTVAPAVTAKLLADTGSSSTDKATSNDSLIGTAASNSLVTLTENSKTLGTVQADSSGVWTFAPTSLSDGVHTIVATDTNAAGVSANASVNFRLDTTAPIVQSEFVSGANIKGSLGVLHAGDAVVFTVGLSEAAIVGGGIPSLKLNNGGTATYDVQHSTATALVFDYTVAAGQSASSLAVTGVNLNGATVADVAGNAVNFSGAVKNFTGISVVATTGNTNTTAPPAPSVNSYSPDSGTVGDDVTNATALTLSGAAEASSTVKVYDGSTLLGTATADNTGAWSFATANLASGSHAFTATATDSAGNISTASSPLTVTVDTTAPLAPTVQSFSPDSGTVGDGVTNATVLTLNGSAEASSTVKIYDGSTLLGTATADNTGAWSFATANLASGSHAFTATATDSAGNISTASSPLTVTVDTTAPLSPNVKSFSPDSGTVGDGVTNATVLTLNGSAEASSTVKVYDGSTLLGTATADANGTWNFVTGSLGNGSHAFTATATDLAGNISTASSALTVLVDTVAPTAPTANVYLSNGTSVGNGSTNATILTLSGTAEASSNVTIYDGSTLLGIAKVALSGAWSLATGTLANGVHVFTTTATDAAGNVSAGSTPVTVAVDTVAPTAPTIANSGQTFIMAATVLTLTGTAETNSAVKIYDGSTLLGTTLASADGTWNLTTPTLSNGSHTFTATATDSADNISALSVPLTEVVDTALMMPTNTGAALAPTISAFSPDSGTVGDGITSATTLTLAGTSDASSSVKIYDGAQFLGTAIADASGTWTFVTTKLASGSHVFTATETNSAGGVSAASSPLTVMVDTTAPIVTAKLLTDTGSSSTDKATSNDSLTGTAAPNSVVTLTENSKTLGTVHADSSGVWTFVPVGLSDGVHTIVATDTNAAGLTATTSLNFRLDTTAPTVQSDAASGADIKGSLGLLHAGDAIVFTVGLLEQATVAGGIPTLTLNDGGTATYDAQHSTPTALAFDYTVAPGQYASSLSVTAVDLNGAKVADVAGNTVTNFATAIKNFTGITVDATTPVTAADHGQLVAGNTLTAPTSAGVLTNDHDVDPYDTLAVSAVNGQAAGVGHAVAGEFGGLILNADGSYIYHNTNVAAVTAAGGVAEDTFTYTTSNGHGGSASSTLDIVITSPGQTYVGGASGSTITGGSGSNVLDGSAGNITAVAGTGTQFLVGGHGDTLTAGSGSDTFIFAANLGQNTVNNFNTRLDTIDLPKAAFSNAATVLADAHQVGSDTVITYDAADTITLTHTLLQDLHASNFILT